MTTTFKIVEPKSIEEFEPYFQLRWEVLRKPWGQPKSSEQDESDLTAIHRMVLDKEGYPIGVGMLLLNSNQEAQIRFMAVSENRQGMMVGTLLIDCLESIAYEHAKMAVYVNELNSTKDAIRLYSKMKVKYPYISDIRLALVQIYSQMENFEKAIQELEEWLIVSPNEEQAIELLKYLKSQA